MSPRGGALRARTLLAAAALATLAPGRLPGQRIPPSALGARARLTRTDGRRQAGVLVATSDSLVVVASRRGGALDSVPLAVLRRLEIANPPRPAFTYTAIGAGLVLGALAGRWAGGRADANCSETCGLGSFFGLVGGATAGLLIGAAVGNHAHWRSIWPSARPGG